MYLSQYMVLLQIQREMMAVLNDMAHTRETLPEDMCKYLYFIRNCVHSVELFFYRFNINVCSDNISFTGLFDGLGYREDQGHSWW